MQRALRFLDGLSNESVLDHLLSISVALTIISYALYTVLGTQSELLIYSIFEDLCSAIYLASEAAPQIANDTYNIGAKEFETMKEDYQAVLTKAGFGKKIIGLPAWPVILTLRVLEFFKLSPLYKWVYETASQDSFVSIEKAENKLGYKPRFSNQQALLRNYDWYLTNMHVFEHSSGVSHRVPWKQGILKLFKIFF